MTRWVVVGAGAAGCVIAARLAEVPGDHVTLVEAGPGVAGSGRSDEPGRLFPGPFARGRGIGGSGAVNGMLATPGDLGQYERWGWTDAGDALARVRVPLEIPSPDELGPLDRALLAAAPDATRARLTRRGGRRVTAFDAYLADTDTDTDTDTDAGADAGVGVTLVADAEVAAVALDGRRAVGVQLADGRHLDTDRVVVTAGAIGTPLLLAASGVDAPALGHGLRNHPGLPISVHVRDGAPGSALLVGALLVRGDLQIVPVHDVVDPAPDTLLVVLMAPTGRGRVRAAGDGVLVEEVLDDHDHARLESGRTIVFELLDHPAFRAVVDDVTVGTAPAMVYHPTSTCAMGTVVDADGAVFGYDGLHVADASVFPDIPRANTYLPTLMLAERLAWRLTRR